MTRDDLNRQIEAEREKLSRAAQAAKDCLATVGDKPTEAMLGDVREKHERAMADVKTHSDAINQLKSRVNDLERLGEIDRLIEAPAETADKVGDELAIATDERRGRTGVAGNVACAKPHGKHYERATNGLVPRDQHRQMFDTYLRRGPGAVFADHAGIAPKVRNALMTSSGELGGFLVPADFRTELISDTSAMSVIFSLARRIPTSTNEASFPTIQSDTGSPRSYRSGFRGTWRSEPEMSSATYSFTAQNQPLFGQVTIPVHSWIPDPVLLTPELMEDAAVNVEAILMDLIAEHLALEMDDMCLKTGTGAGQPKSIINDSDVAIITATAAASIDYNAYIDLIFGSTGLPAQYRAGATLVMNTATYAATLKLNDGSDRPLINVFTSPDTIYGYPIVFSEFLAVPASSAKVAIFGNFQNYGIAERVDLRIQRLDERFAPNVAFLARARYGGGVLRPAAFKILKCAA